MPTWKQDMLEAYEKWKHREPPTFNTQESVREEKVVASEDEEAADMDNDVLEVMLALGRGVAVNV